MENTYITENSKQTQKIGETLAEELRGGEIIGLSGELGSGKTTFAQGVLKGLGAKGPYTSPTFVVMKYYKAFLRVRPFPLPHRRTPQGRTLGVYHIDAYRVGAKDILDLGWEEIIASKNNIVIIEWAEKMKSIIPRRAIWIRFEHVDKNKRRIVVSDKVISPGSLENKSNDL